MATVLENYNNIRKLAETLIAQGGGSSAVAWQFEEAVYRIGVLETCQMFCRTAPVTTDTREMQGHYQMLDAYVQCIAQERRYGPGRGENTQKERETAQLNLSRVVQDYRKRFSSFAPTTAEAYSQEIGKLINTLLPAWLQFREVFIPLKQNQKEAQNT